jgi:hypothetical protein
MKYGYAPLLEVGYALIEEIRFAVDSPLEGADLPPMIKRKKAGQ